MPQSLGQEVAMLIRELTFAAIGTSFTCLATVLGAAMVFSSERT